MTWIRTSILTFGLLAFVVFFGTSCSAPVHHARARRPVATFGGGSVARGLVVVDGVPPAPLVEEIYGSPYDDGYWVSGYWDWDGYSWVWIPGHWEVAPPGFVWVGPAYSNYGSYCEYTPGFWQPAEEAAPAPDRPSSYTGVSTARPTPPKVRVEGPNTTTIRPSYTTETIDHAQPSIAPNPSQTVRVNPNIAAEPVRPRVKPTLRDFDDDPKPRQIVPQQPITRPEAKPRSTFAPSLTPSPRAPAFNPPPASSVQPTIRSNSPAFTPAPRSQSFTPRSYTPPPQQQPTVKPQTPVYTPSPSKSASPSFKPSKK